MTGKTTVNIPNPVIKDWAKHRDLYKKTQEWKEKKYEPMIEKLKKTLKDKFPTSNMDLLDEELY